MINKVILVGRVGGTPETFALTSGGVVLSLSLATSKSKRDAFGDWKETTTWHTIKVFGQLAERLEGKINKGALVYVEGEINKRSYEDKTGAKRYAVEIIAYKLRTIQRAQADIGHETDNETKTTSFDEAPF